LAQGLAKTLGGPDAGESPSKSLVHFRMAPHIAQALLLCVPFIIPSCGQTFCSLIQKSAWVDALDDTNVSQHRNDANTDMDMDHNMHAELASKAAEAKEAAKNGPKGEQKTSQSEAKEAAEGAKGEEKAGREADSSDATAASKAANYAKGLNNYALDFDGVDDKVELPSINGIESITMWVNVDKDESENRLAYLLDARSGRNDAYVSTQGIEGFNSMYVDGAFTKKSWDNIPKGGWHHICLNLKDTYNGALTLASGYETKTGKSVAHTDSLKVQIDEVGIWNDTFTKSELGAMMEDVTSSPHEPLAYYNFDDGPGRNLLKDSTNNQHHGRLVNMDKWSAWIGGREPHQP